MARMVASLSLLVVMLVLSVPALAQTTTTDTPQFTRCTTANVFGGGTFISDEHHPVLGGAVGWELMPHLTAEATFRWLTPQQGSTAMSALFTAQVPMRWGGRLVPFIAGGAGLHHATFDLSHGPLPDFYQRRVTSTLATGQQAFDDPAYVVSAGVSFFPTRHMSIRPELETMLVRGGGENLIGITAAVRIAFHFEDHGVTSARKPR